MRPALLLGAMIVLGMPIAHTAFAQTVTKISITFHTTRDDKDGDTQIRDRVIISGQDYATLFCCSAGKHSPEDHWDNNSTKTRFMTIVRPLSKPDIDNALIEFTESPVGNDTWIFIPTVSATFSDGSHQEWTFPEISIFGGNPTTCRFSTGQC